MNYRFYSNSEFTRTCMEDAPHNQRLTGYQAISHDPIVDYFPVTACIIVFDSVCVKN